MEFVSRGKLVYDPEMFKRASKPAPWWLIIESCQGIVDYYNHLVHKRTGLKLLKPSWGSHISVIRGEEPPDEFKHLWKFDNGKEIEFKYTNNIRFNDDYWWIDVESEELLELREKLGLSRRPFFRLHITIGKLPMEVREIVKIDNERL